MRVSAMAKTYRIKDGFDERLERLRIEMIIKTKENVTEAEILHALLLKHLNDITQRDVQRYRNWLAIEEEEDPREKERMYEEARIEEEMQRLEDEEENEQRLLDENS